MPDELAAPLAAALGPPLTGAKVIVFCSQQADVAGWRHLLGAVGVAADLVLAFDGPELTSLLPATPSRSATQLITDRHELLATLAGDSPLSRLLDRFDPTRSAWTVVTDPLDPPLLGSRRQLGGKHPSWAMFEHKSTVDALWDSIGLTRAESVVFDRPGRLLDDRTVAEIDAVASSQRRGATPSAGGGEVRRFTSLTEAVADGPARVRVVPALDGLPCRLHGLVLTEATAAFPPLELLVPHRPDDGAYLSMGTWPFPGPGRIELTALSRWVGDRLRDRLSYRGGFSVDGILTADGFRPTDLNTRVTSAFETLPSAVRVAVHAASLVARADLAGVDAGTLARCAGRAFDEQDELVLRVPVRQATQEGALAVRWNGATLERATTSDRHGLVGVGDGARGRTMTVRLERQHLPSGLALQLVAVAALHAADRLLNTGFGRLRPPRPAVTAVPAWRDGSA